MSSDGVAGKIDGKERAEIKRKPENRPFPRKPLAEAMRVIIAIKEQNAGRAWSAEHVASAIGKKQRSSDFQYIISAARDFGLISGNFRSDAIELTELGRKLAYPSDADIDLKAKFEAFSNINIFKNVFEYYEGSKLPEQSFFKNTLINNFKINVDYIDEFISLFEGNCRFIGIDPKTNVSFKAENKIKIDDGSISIESQKAIVRSGRNLAFVIMPFTERGDQRSQGFFKEVFHSLIRPAAEAAGFEVDWANQAGSDLIQSTIVDRVFDADLVIADLTDHNPNVLFELGLRIGDNKKPIALIKSKDTPRIFDVDNLMRVYEYSQLLWKTTIEIDIPNMESHIRAAWETHDNSKSYISILRRNG